MNTKIIVALVIGMALVGLTGAATATNNIVQDTDTYGLMIGDYNTVTQNSLLVAGIVGDSDGNLITQDLTQFALAIGGSSGIGNGVGQEATMIAEINNGDDNNIDQRILQAGVAFGDGNTGMQRAMQIGYINDTDQQFIDQDIDQFQIAFALDYSGVCNCINGSTPWFGSINESACDPCEMLEEGCNNGAMQDDTQIAVILGEAPCAPVPG